MLYSTGAPYTGDALEELAAACDTRGSDKVAGVCLANFAKKYRDISGYVVTPEWILDRLSGLFGAEITTVALLSGWPAAERRAAMALVNQSESTYMNGTLGTIVDCRKDGVVVDFDSSGRSFVSAHTCRAAAPRSRAPPRRPRTARRARSSRQRPRRSSRPRRRCVCVQ